MRIPVDWLNEYVPNELSMGDLAFILTNVGLEVEAIESSGGATIFDIKVTPNRGDCLSVMGVARELGMTLRCAVKDRLPHVDESGPSTESLVKITLDDPRLCPRYSARILQAVKIGPSPEWARKRLELCGLRPINNVVDATNLAMLELGQPLHAFDYGLVARSGENVPEILVRRARKGERLTTIDGEERELNEDILLIADQSGPIALAGVMGGASTEIHNGTSEVLLESAHFDPTTIRRGARLLGMSTEASYRFERTVDPGGTIRALYRVCELIAEFSEGAVRITEGVADAYPKPFKEREIALRSERANSLLGLDLSTNEVAEYLRWLSLDVLEGEPLTVRAPTFRQDLRDEIDLIEEVARVHGYENIPERLPEVASGVGALSPEVAFERDLRHLLRGMGLSECVTSSLEGADAQDRLNLPDDDRRRRAVVLSNWKTIDRSQLRTTLLTSMLDIVAHNRRHGIEDVGIFDVGRVYLSRGEESLPEQPQHLGMAVTGVMTKARWAMPRELMQWDFYGLKAVAENIVQAIIGRPAEFENGPQPCLEPGRSATISIDGQVVGFMGEVRADLRDSYDLPDPVFVAELDLEVLRKNAAEEPQYEGISRFPAVTRDIAFLVSREVPAERARRVIEKSAGGELEAVELFDAFEGKPLAEGQRNLAFSMRFRRKDRTMMDDEVEAAMNRIREALKSELEAQIRQ